MIQFAGSGVDDETGNLPFRCLRSRAMRSATTWGIQSELHALLTAFAANPLPLNALVVGPPGSGRTTVVKEAAKSASVELLELSSSVLAQDDPECIQAQVTSLFVKALKAPCVLFFDDIDYWLPKSVDSEKGLHLLAVLIDQLEQLRESPFPAVAFIASARHAADVHPALSIFSHDEATPLRVVRVKPLTEEDRRVILHGVFGETEEQGEIESVVLRTPGYVAVDMARLLSEARRNMRERADANSLQIGDATAALSKVQPLLLGSENKQWQFLSGGRTQPSPIFGLHNAQESIRQCLHSIFSQRGTPAAGELAARKALAGLGYVRGIVLHGASGTGKSRLLQAAASMVPAGTVNVMRIDSTDVVSSVIGEAERLVVGLFVAARAAAPTLILMENLHILAPRRTDAQIASEGASKAFERLLSTFLVELDGVREETGPEREIVLLSTTSSLKLVDPAMLRPGRFELHVETQLPNAEERRRAFQHAISSMVPDETGAAIIGDEEFMERLSVWTEGWKVPDLFALVREVVFLILRDGPIETSEESWKKALTLSRVTAELNKHLIKNRNTQLK